METTERIVEAYVRYLKGWFTLPNIKCGAQREIDLLAIDPNGRGPKARFHIESGVSISSGFSRLTAKPFSEKKLKTRAGQAPQRRTLGYFTERKFGHPSVLEKLATYRFKNGHYTKVIVSWGWRDDVPRVAKEASVVLWDFRDILREIAEAHRVTREYFTDDTMRTLQLMSKVGSART